MGVKFLENHVVIKNLPDVLRGCGTATKDDFTHLGMLFERITACGGAMGDIFLSDEVIVTCPVCVAEIKYRRDHPEAAKQPMGVVTHRDGFYDT
jgi:hypothetical protein